jgi:pilus assembly protein CpaC
MNAVAHLRAVALLLAALMALGGGYAPGTALANGEFPRHIQLSDHELANNRAIRLGVNKSLVIELPRAAGDVLVSNPEVADAVLRTANRLYLIGVKLGQANVFLFDSAGVQIASFDIYVEPDLTALNGLLREAIPTGSVRADAMNGNIVLRGEVLTATDSARAQEITVGMLEGSAAGTNGGGGATEKNVVNLLTVLGVDQVQLKVTIAEVQREVVKQLGINTQAILNNGGEIAFGSITHGALGAALTGAANLSPFRFPINTATNPAQFGVGFNGNDGSISAMVRALEEANMIRTLAEPNLTAVSGETANFLAGGEFPIPVASDDEGITVAFKQFGVNLAFTPVVLGPGRISLKVRTEVSDLAAEGSFAANFGVTIPGITVRRAETTVELPSGGAFMIAGLIKEETRRSLSGLPALNKLPILGTLFSSKDFLRSETELVIIVTPYLVRPVSPQKLKRPDDNLVMANDAEAYFLGRLTKIYGSAGTQPRGHYSGHVGFSFD